MGRRWALPFVLMCIAGCSEHGPSSTNGTTSGAFLSDQQRCFARDISISGCTAIIQSGKETPENLTNALLNRGDAYGQEGQYDRAIEDFDQAVRLSPNNATAFLARGAGYASSGQQDRAILDYDQAIRLNPNYAEAFYNRGVAFRAKGQSARAAADFAKARQLNPNLPPP